jgi:hypothetical protein
MPPWSKEPLFAVVAAASDHGKTKNNLKKIAVLGSPNMCRFASWALIWINSKRH